MDTDDFVTSGAVDADDVNDALENIDDLDEVVAEDGVEIDEDKTNMFTSPIESLLRYHPIKNNII